MSTLVLCAFFCVRGCASVAQMALASLSCLLLECCFPQVLEKPENVMRERVRSAGRITFLIVVLGLWSGEKQFAVHCFYVCVRVCWLLWVGTLNRITFLIVVLGLWSGEKQFAVHCFYVCVRMCWVLWVEPLKAEISKLKSEACSPITITKWWIIMVTVCFDVWSTSFELGTSLYKLGVELCKRNLPWKWCQNRLKRWRFESERLHMKSKWAARYIL